MLPIVAIIGRPNVGKSSLFNRILGQRAAVVDDCPGVTRDRHYKPSSWQGLNFELVDTGGMFASGSDPLSSSINGQVLAAIEEASAVLFVVEAGCGITDEDGRIAAILRKEAAGRCFLVVNKIESPRLKHEIHGFSKLGLGDGWPVSAAHGSGVGDLLDAVVRHLKKQGLTVRKPESGAEGRLKIAIVGRPNVGKSSLVNKLLGTDRMIVTNVPGTTRDSIDSEMTYRNHRILLIDTAGLRKKSHAGRDLEYYFNLRSIESIGRCDVCVILVDATEGICEQDLRIVRMAVRERRGMLVAFNKWDKVEKTHKTFDALAAETKRRYRELRYTPFIAISALTGRRVTAVPEQALAIHERMAQRVPQAAFEDAVFAWVRAHPHPAIPTDPVRFFGARQIASPVPLFRFFVSNPTGIAPEYIRYLSNQMYDAYGFEGCPLTLEFKAVRSSDGAAKT